jgi:hypothetical protein
VSSSFPPIKFCPFFKACSEKGDLYVVFFPYLIAVYDKVRATKSLFVIWPNLSNLP